MDVDISSEQARELVAVAGTTGTDLEQLKALAELHGVYGLGAQMTLAQLKQLRLYAIAHLEGHRFVAVTGYSPSGVQVVPPLGKPHHLSDHEFEKDFGQRGRVLLLARSVLTPERLGLASAEAPRRDGPRLRAASNALGVGWIRRSAWSRDLVLHNDGNAPLQLGTPKVSCSCMTPRLDRQVIPAGGTATLTIDGNQYDPGAFLYHVAITSSDPANKTLVLPIRGYLSPPIRLQAGMGFRNILVDQVAERDIPLRLEPGAGAADVVWSVPDEAPLSLEVPDAEAPHSLRVRWLGSRRIGQHDYVIQIGTKHLNRKSWRNLTISAKVVPAAVAFPRSLFIGTDELSSTWARRVELQSNKGGVGVSSWAWSSSDLAETIEVEVVADSVGKHTAILRPRSDTLRSTDGRKGHLQFTFDDGSTVRVGLYFGPTSYTSPTPEASDATANNNSTDEPR